MGIKGLLAVWKKEGYLQPCHLKDYRGATAAIDFSCLMFRTFHVENGKYAGASFSSMRYYVRYFNLLKYFNIVPKVIFDGRRLPAKEITHLERQKTYAKMKARKVAELRDKAALETDPVEEKLLLERADREENRVSKPNFGTIAKIMDILRNMKIDFVVAPYEADSQLAWLAINKVVHVVFTADSDFPVFGCDKVVYDLQSDGTGLLFDAKILPKFVGLPLDQYEFHKFRKLAILAGCDYLKSVPGIGIQKARQVIVKSGGNDYASIVQALPPANVVPVGYEEGFVKTEFSFTYPTVFNVRTKKLAPLNEYADDMNMDLATLDICKTFAGKCFKAAKDFAFGNIDPLTMDKVGNFNPCDPCHGYPVTSWWHLNYQIPQPVHIYGVKDSKTWNKLRSILGRRPVLRCTCHTPPKFFRVPCQLAAHERLATKTFVCEHKISTTVEGEVREYCCSKRFGCQYFLDRHKRVHTGEKPFKCRFCDKRFSRKDMLTRHIRSIHSVQKPYQCKHEGCSSSFTRKDELKQHSVVHTGEKNFKCSQCEAVFGRKSTLNDHILTHTGEKKFKCSECDESFLLKSALDRHILTHTGEKKFKCSECNASFLREDTLTEHMAIHAKTKNFVCSVCGTAFAQKRALRRHMLTHSKVRSHVCECGESFPRSDSLKRHKERAHSNKPLMKHWCRICKNKSPTVRTSYAQRGSLEAHMKSAHPNN